MSFLKRLRKQPEPKPAAAPPPSPVPESRAKGFVPPPPRESMPVYADPRADRLLKRIEAIEDEIESIERSGDPDSPYQQRISTLNAALESVEREINAAASLETRLLPTLPATPITDINVALDPVPTVAFSIGGERFLFAEEIDWAERGTQIFRGDLLAESGDIPTLLPEGLDPELGLELAEHLERSLFAFATDLRDCVIEDRAFPAGVTLADLAVPSARCGDWELWGGVSLRCLEHESRLRDLNAERTRLLNERGTEIEERQRQVEELPLHRRRLSQAIADLQALDS